MGYYPSRVEDERGMTALIATWVPEVGCAMLKGNGIFDCQSERSK